ncbi:hypothetical protein B0J11DRAFT_590486 [Dendryphion nanum]|uniref:Uncharacterized protein n=1 Tax=Dendryphion nanum TaxID=256645 RepID=A0A9P9DFF9_9PLEO|nr:hypothetical protein B0J11DRAFT_590486 [Dendryphion nanum]
MARQRQSESKREREREAGGSVGVDVDVRSSGGCNGRGRGAGESAAVLGSNWEKRRDRGQRDRGRAGERKRVKEKSEEKSVCAYLPTFTSYWRVEVGLRKAAPGNRAAVQPTNGTTVNNPQAQSKQNGAKVVIEKWMDEAKAREQRAGKEREREGEEKVEGEERCVAFKTGAQCRPFRVVRILFPSSLLGWLLVGPCRRFPRTTTAHSTYSLGIRTV